MKLKFLSLVFVLFLMCASSPVVVEAQSNHNLEWGVEVDDTFTYVLQRAYLADPSYIHVLAETIPYVTQMTVGEKTTLRVVTLEEVPSEMNANSPMPLSECNFERANDSTLLFTGALDLVIPIGDWDLVSEMSNITGQEGVTLVNSTDEWGWSGTGQLTAGDGSVISIYLEIRYEKENGTLSYLRHRYSTLGTDLIDIIFVHWYPGMPTEVGGELQLTTILITSIAAVVCFIIGICIYQGYKKKKPVVQKLGE